RAAIGRGGHRRRCERSARGVAQAGDDCARRGDPHRAREFVDRARRRPAGRAHRSVRLPRRRDAAPASLTPGSALVNDAVLIDEQAVRRAAAAVPDPELPMVTIEDLGILRDVTVSADGRVAVTITPTYSGCPAMEAIAADIREA